MAARKRKSSITRDGDVSCKQTSHRDEIRKLAPDAHVSSIEIEHFTESAG